ncbi:MAG TPA: ABC transporter permease [Candidatus Binatia bacterium]|nr:ABC transporter permease [Candidatus Binatia bacterium]
MNRRRLWTLVRREVRATFRDPFTVTMLISVPIAALLLFGFILTTDVKHLSLGLYDGARSAASRRLVADLAANGTFDVTAYESPDAIGDALQSGVISVGLVIPVDFDDDTRRSRPGAEPPRVQVLYDGGEAALAGNAEAFAKALLQASAPSLGDAARDPRRSVFPGRERAEGGIGVVARAVFNPGLEGKPFMVAGTFGFVLSFLTTLITAVSIVNEKRAGTFEQLQVTPATSTEILLGKLLPLGAVFAFDVVLMMLVAGLAMRVWPEGSALLFVGVSSYYVLISLALGLIFSATSATAAEAVQKTVLFSIPLVQLSGFIFPVRNMPTVVQWLSNLLPATHYIRISRAIYMRAEGPLSMTSDFFFLFVFGVGAIYYARRVIEART